MSDRHWYDDPEVQAEVAEDFEAVRARFRTLAEQVTCSFCGAGPGQACHPRTVLDSPVPDNLGAHLIRVTAATPSTGTCGHWSASGVDATDLNDPNKVWRCDGCGLRWTNAGGKLLADTEAVVFDAYERGRTDHWAHDCCSGPGEPCRATQSPETK